MFDSDVLSQLQSLSALTGLEPSEFGHVIFGEPVQNAENIGTNIVLANIEIPNRIGLILTNSAIWVSPFGHPPLSAVRLLYSFFPFNGLVAGHDSDFVCTMSMSLDGVPLIPVGEIEPLQFAGACLHPILSGNLVISLSVTTKSDNPTSLVARFEGFFCPIEAANKLRASRTNFLSSVT